MAYSSEIIAKLGLDSSAFVRDLKSIPDRVAEVGGKATSELKKTFKFENLFKGVMQGVGIASVQQLADKIVEPFRESAESAERLAQYSERAADATERLLASRRSDAQQLAALEKQYKRISDEASKPADISIWQKMGMAITYGPLLAMEKIKQAQGELNAEKQAKASAELAEKGLQIEEQKSRIKKKTEQEARQRENEEMRALEDAYRKQEQRAAATKSLADYEAQQRREKMTDEARIADLQKEQQENAKELAVYEKERKAGAELTAYGAERVLELKKRQVEIEREIKEATEKKQEAEANIAKAVEKQNQLLTVQFEIRGRDNSQLSDRELASKASNLRQSLLGTQLRDMAPVGLDVFGSSLVTSLDPLKFFKEQELASLLAVQRERATVRRNAAFFGEERAFQMSGLSEQQFRDILAGEISNAEARRTADATEELVRLLSTGQGRMATVVLNPTPSS